MKKTERYVVEFRHGIHSPVTVEAADEGEAVRMAVAEQRRTSGGDGILDMRPPAEVVASVRRV